MNETSATFDIDADGVIDAVRKSICPPDATKEECEIFFAFIRSTKLNPYKREVWFIKAGGRVQIMTGINGYLSIANSQASYDGMDEPEFYYDNNDRLVSCKVKVWRKDRSRPTVAHVFMREYSSGNGNWKTKEHVMLSKVAKSVALREAFIQILGGSYIQEELDAVPAFSQPRIVQNHAKQIAHVVKAKLDERKAMTHEETVSKLIDAFADIEVGQVQVEEFMQKTVEEFNSDDVSNLREIYKKIKSGEHKMSEYFIEGVTGEL